MVCRSTPGNSALTTLARLRTGLDDVHVLSLFHQCRADAPPAASAPSRDEYVQALQEAAETTRNSSNLTQARRNSILRRLERAMESPAPDGATYYAWRTINSRCVAAQHSLNNNLAAIAQTHNSTPEEARAAFNELTQVYRTGGREVPTPPRTPEDDSLDSLGVPRDRATRFALNVLRNDGPQATHSRMALQRSFSRILNMPADFTDQEYVPRSPEGYVTSDGRNFGDDQRLARRWQYYQDPDAPSTPIPAQRTQEDIAAAHNLVRVTRTEPFTVTTTDGQHFSADGNVTPYPEQACRDAVLHQMIARDRALVASGLGPQRCPECGRFMSAEGQCQFCASGGAEDQYATAGVDTPPATNSVEGELTEPIHLSVSDSNQTWVGRDGVIYPDGDAARRSFEADQQPTPDPEPEPEPAPAPVPRRRGPQRGWRDYRTTRSDGTSGPLVNMTNVSRVRADIREAGVGQPVNVRVTAWDGEEHVEGEVTIVQPRARTPRGEDRYTSTTSSLRCTCPDYRENYDCVHVRDVAAAAVAAMNGNTTIPAVATQAVNDANRREHEQSLDAATQAREAAQNNLPAVKFADNMEAFQEEWDTAKAYFAEGNKDLPYLTENATNGHGARDGGRSFGIEIEVDFPNDMTYQAKARVAREMYEAGLSRSPHVQGWHYADRGGGGYSDAPNAWNVEFDRTVDDVGGRRGCEIVSPILYDEPQTWENIQKVCDILERNGAAVNYRHGFHVNVGASDLNHTVANHNRLLSTASAYEDVIIRAAHNPSSGQYHRGRTYCTTSRVPATGYRTIRQAQQNNGHRSMINLDHVPAEHESVRHSTRVEMRMFDGAITPGRMQANVNVALTLMDMAVRGVEPPSTAEPAGTHRERNSDSRGRARRLEGEEWTRDSQSMRSFLDNFGERQRTQIVHSLAETRWQRADRRR